MTASGGAIDPVPPKAFLSHASEDKDRFVRGLAERLRAAGVDAWFDEWEIKGGDSLVERIFAIGIAQAKAFLVVLSQFSVDKPWVNAELDVAVVRNIETQTKLIPIRLDKVEVPVAVSAKKWIPVDDLTSYDAAFDDILQSIFDTDTRPPIGRPPGYARNRRITGLQQADTTVLTVLVERALETDFDSVQADELDARAKSAGLNETSINQSLDALKAGYYVDFGGTIGWHHSLLTVQLRGWLPILFDDFDDVRTRLIGLLVNEYSNGVDTRALAERLDRPRRLVVAIARDLEQHDLVALAEASSNYCYIYRISSLLARELD